MNNAIYIPQIFCLSSMLFVLGLGFFVLWKNKRSPLNILFFLITIVFAMWEFGTFMMFGSISDESITFWDRFLYLAVVFVPALQYHFSVASTRTTFARSMMVKICYLLGLFFLFISRTDLFVSGVFRYDGGSHTRAQLFHHVFLIYFFFYIFALLYNFWEYRKTTDSLVEKHRVLYFIIGFATLNLLGGMGYLPAYGIAVYPIALVSPVIFTIIISYAIVYYRLMNIRFVLRNSVVFSLALLTTGLVSFGLKAAIGYFPHGSSLWFDFMVLIVALMIFKPLSDYYFYVANKYFFSSLYDAPKVISDLSQQLSSTLDAQKVFEIIDNSLVQALHPKSLAIFDYNEHTTFYEVVFNYGFKFKRNTVKASRYVASNYLRRNDVVILEDVKTLGHVRALAFVAQFRESMGVEVLVPMNVKDKPVGFIALGGKESGDIYNNEDLKLLNVIGRQTAMSLENAFLYQEARSFNEKLSREVEHATRELRSANAELKKLDEAKSEFISIASHQLRTPLTVIKGYSSMMIEGSFGSIPDPIMLNIKKIFESNERLIALVEDLLNISRIESGRLQFNFEVCQLEDLVANVVEELKVNVDTKGLFLSFKPPAKPLAKVKIDKAKIRQVIINIIDNAIKYTSVGGITVVVSQKDDLVRFIVVDTGIGISHEDMPYLFKKFSRGEGISVVHTEGTGLGLYVGKMMVEEHGGRIWAQSEGDDKGATFGFELPIAKMEAAPK